jgi:hypothetical protein
VVVEGLELALHSLACRERSRKRSPCTADADGGSMLERQPQCPNDLPMPRSPPRRQWAEASGRGSFFPMTVTTGQPITGASSATPRNTAVGADRHRGGHVGHPWSASRPRRGRPPSDRWQWGLADRRIVERVAAGTVVEAHTCRRVLLAIANLFRHWPYPEGQSNTSTSTSPRSGWRALDGAS